MKLTLAVASVLVAGLGIAGNRTQTVQGSGRLQTEKRTVGSFDKIKLDSAGNLNIQVGGPISVEITAENNILPLLSSTVKDKTLTLASKGSMSTKKGITYKITVPSLDLVTIDGSGKVVVTGAKGKRLGFDVSGSADIEAIGKVDQVVVNIDGSGNLKLFGLQATNALVKIDGSGSIKTSVSKDLKVSIDGNGNIQYKGNPKITKSIDGNGTITKA